MFQKLLNHLPHFLRPAIFISGLGDVLSLWQSTGTKERGILILVFAPMFLCLGGLLLSVVSFVLFVLPSFILRVLGWAILTAIFGAGGRYFYERMTGRSVPRDTPVTGTYEETYTDVKFTEDGPDSSGEGARRREDIRQRWFERVRWKK
ncbi:MAG: hypothetical protein IJ702_04110 [Fretibacterium sp.]|nr:hypothetical protein [Fretibacterium sp.]